MAKYSNYNNVFLVRNVAKFPKNTGINKQNIKLAKHKQLLFEPIYSLELIELETFKTYIKINLANGFIQFSKSLTNAFILFDKKLDESFHLYIDYWGFNNLIIQNQYLLPLIGKSLD